MHLHQTLECRPIATTQTGQQVYYFCRIVVVQATNLPVHYSLTRNLGSEWDSQFVIITKTPANRAIYVSQKRLSQIAGWIEVRTTTRKLGQFGCEAIIPADAPTIAKVRAWP